MQGNHVFQVPDGYKLKVAPGTSGRFYISILESETRVEHFQKLRFENIQYISLIFGFQILRF